jgi:hypothetical protein
MNFTTKGFLGAVAITFLATGCVKTAAPFDMMKDGSVAAYRLQNYEPPATAPGTATPAAGPVAGLPPQIQQWVQQAQGMNLEQLIPPGLLPPDLLQGLGGQQPAPAQTAPPETVPRFPEAPPNFRILSQTQVVDPTLKKQLAKVLGNKKSFSNEHANCMYAELGIRFGQPPAPPQDVLISFSCNQVASRGFAWPHPSVGMKPETVKKLAAIVNDLFPPGT